NSRTGGSASAVRTARVSNGSSPRSSASNRMSTARLRALLRVERLTRRSRGAEGGSVATSATDATEVVAGAGVDLGLLAGGQEQRDLDLQSGLHGGGLGATAGAGALQPGLGVGDLQRDRGGQVQVQRVALVQRHGGHLLLEQVVLGVADGLVGDRDLVEGGGVHEHETGTV